MSQFEPSRILDNPRSSLDSENVQQYVEIGANTYLGTKDGIKYALLPTLDNKFKLCEVLNDTSLSNSSSWSDSFQDNIKCDTTLTTPPASYKTIKLITVKREITPCRGQGDESGNSIISTPDSTSRFKNADHDILEKNSELFEGNPTQTSESSQLTYTTLMPRQEPEVDSLDTTSYGVPGTYFQFPTPLRTTSSTKPSRYMKSRPRMQLASNPANPYPQCSPIPQQRGRVHKQRRPRQVYYQYRSPVMHSTPTSTCSSSLSDSCPMSSVDTASSSSISSGNESHASLEYPRVPNNTPCSGEEDSSDKQKVFNMQWIPQIQTRIANYIQMDPRETHNEKERKRRLRIKNACQLMKSLLPCVCNKTDNASVFENAVYFIAFMRETVGSEYDMEFLEQTCIY